MLREDHDGAETAIPSHLKSSIIRSLTPRAGFEGAQIVQQRFGKRTPWGFERQTL
jgi:hypothetical protein